MLYSERSSQRYVVYGFTAHLRGINEAERENNDAARLTSGRSCKAVKHSRGAYGASSWSYSQRVVTEKKRDK